MKRKSGITRHLRAAVTAALLGGCFGLSPAAYALPVGGASSTATISTSGSTMNITGAANNLITWVDFSIGSTEKVVFDANNYLNYVTGNNMSSILGTLTGSGTIYLVNPNGISIGEGASIDVGTLHLSTADLSGKLTDYTTALNALNQAANFVGDVVNKGNLTAAKEITVQGKNITFKNIENVTVNGTANSDKIKVNINNNTIQVYGATVSEGEVHVGYDTDTAPTIKYTGNTTPLALKLIRTPEELKNISLDGKYMLAGDIDLQGSSSNPFTPIGGGGTINQSGHIFNGRLDGLGYAIKNLYVDVTGNEGTAGLFNTIGSNGRVENLTLSSGTVNLNGAYDAQGYLGAFAGLNVGILRNVVNDGVNVTGVAIQSGGIVGHNYSYIEGATNNADVITNAGNATGGITGQNSQASTSVILNSVNTGKIEKSGNEMNGNVGFGGIVGRNSGKVSHVRNEGEVSMSGLEFVGGVAGRNAGTVEYAANSGAVTGKSNVGGITGRSTTGSSISIAYNTGIISGNGTDVGGIAGDSAGTIDRVYNGVSVSSNAVRVGGIVGNLGYDGEGQWNTGSGSITNAYNMGNVSSNKEWIGGIAGSMWTKPGEIALKNVYNSGSVTITYTNAGGAITDSSFAGNRGLIENAYYNCDVSNGGAGTPISAADMLKAATFRDFSITTDGSDTSAVWRIYEGKTMPLLTAFMTPLKLADTTLIYDGQAHSIGNLASIDTNKISGGNLPLHTQVGNYEYTELQSLYSDQFGYNINAPNDTATLTIEKGAEVTEQSVPAPSNPGSSSSSSSSSGSGSGSTSTPTPIPAPVTEITPTAPVTTAAPAQAEPSTSTSIPATAQAVERQLEARGVDAGQLEAATNSVYPNVQSSTAAATLSAENRAEGAQSANAPTAPARADLNLSWGADGLLTLENKGVNAPVSMQAEILAATAGNNGPATGSRTTAPNTSQPAGSENAQKQESSQSDSADSTEKNDKNRDSE